MKKYIRKMAFVALVAAMAVLLSSFDTSVEVLKVQAAPTQEDLNKAQQEKNELENRKNELEENIDDMKGEQNTLKGELNKLNSQLKKISDNLEELEKRIAEKEQEIADTGDALEEAKKTEEQQYEDMVLRIRKMYERNDNSNLNAVVNSFFDKDSFSALLNTADSYEKIAKYDNIKLDEFKQNRQLVEMHEALLKQEKAELDGLKLDAETEKNKVAGLVGATSNSISKYAGEISAAEEQALAYEAEIKAKEDVIKKIKEELALSDAAANGVWRDISEVEFAEGDRYLLANLIYCEAGAEPYEGQVAVGAVVINRVLSEKFPDSVVGVIYQNRQFSPVASGRLELALGANKATPACYKAADEAMSGVTNVGKCLFFRTPIEGLEGIHIGGHVFY